MTHCDGKLYYCSDWKGNRRIDLKIKTNQLLVPTKDIGQYSYISSDGNKFLYTSNTGTVTCCDMNGKQIWRFQDTSLLRSPRGVVVDNQGFVFVAGEKSRSIVVISPDGNSAKEKEVYQISSPRGIRYNKSENEILVCHTDRTASWFQISLDV
jgi:DNA-binding beta-propeller fold protein YncE